MSIIDIAQISAVLIAAIGLFVTAYQVRRSTQQLRYEQISSLIKHIFDNEGLSKVYYKIEYGDFKYNSDFHKSDEEKYMDQLLRHFELASKLYMAGQIKNEQLDIIKYEFLTIYSNPEVNKYLAFLDDLFKHREVKDKPYSKFRIVGGLIS